MNINTYIFIYEYMHIDIYRHTFMINIYMASMYIYIWHSASICDMSHMHT